MATAILALALGASAQSIDDLNFYADVTGTFPRIWPICNTTVVDSLLQAAPDFCRSTLRDQLFSNGPILDIASCDCLLNVNKTELESDLGFCRASDKSLDPVRRAYSTCEARQSTPTCTAQQVDESVENAQPYCKSVIAQYASDEQAEKTSRTMLFTADATMDDVCTCVLQSGWQGNTSWYTDGPVAGCKYSANSTFVSGHELYRFCGVYSRSVSSVPVCPSTRLQYLFGRLDEGCQNTLPIPGNYSNFPAFRSISPGISYNGSCFNYSSPSNYNYATRGAFNLDPNGTFAPFFTTPASEAFSGPDDADTRCEQCRCLIEGDYVPTRANSGTGPLRFIGIDSTASRTPSTDAFIRYTLLAATWGCRPFINRTGSLRNLYRRCRLNQERPPIPQLPPNQVNGDQTPGWVLVVEIVGGVLGGLCLCGIGYCILVAVGGAGAGAASLLKKEAAQRKQDQQMVEVTNKEVL